ncbi:MAG: hypothetical protein ACRD2A_16980, partial [Vicinamibacterales bacterium]
MHCVANEDKATRYHRLQRRASMLGTGVGALLLLLLLLSGGSVALRDAVSALVGPSFVLATACYVVALASLHEILQLPLSFYQGVT